MHAYHCVIKRRQPANTTRLNATCSFPKKKTGAPTKYRVSSITLVIQRLSAERGTSRRGIGSLTNIGRRCALSKGERGYRYTQHRRQHADLAGYLSFRRTCCVIIVMQLIVGKRFNASFACTRWSTSIERVDRKEGRKEVERKCCEKKGDIKKGLVFFRFISKSWKNLNVEK